MANWKRKISIEVQIPYVTQGCTIGILRPVIDILDEDVWYSQRGRICWRAYIPWGDHPILVSGKLSLKRDGSTSTTTCKVRAHCSCDGMTEGKVEYKCRVVGYE